METEILTNQETNTQNAEQTEPKTFTQEDVDRIVTKRVARYSDYEALKEKAAKYDEQVEASPTYRRPLKEQTACRRSSIPSGKRPNSEICATR